MVEKNQTANDAVTSELVITRVFDAPRKLVFKAWTEAKRIAQWWGPKGSTIKVSRLDLCPGGVFLCSMSGPPHNTTIWGKFIFREITAPEKLVFINCFADENGNTIPCPFFDVWPLEVLNTIMFIEKDGKTTLTISAAPINASQEERKMFTSMMPGMETGFGGTFDQLEEYLLNHKD